MPFCPSPPNQLRVLRNLRYFFIPYLVQVLTYLLISLVPLLFIPASLSVRPFLICYAIVNYVDSTSCPCDSPPPELRTHSSSRTPIPVPTPPLDSELLLYLNPLYLSIQTNLIIAFLTLRLSHSVNLLRLILCLRTLSDSGLRSPRNYRTYR